METVFVVMGSWEDDGEKLVAVYGTEKGAEQRVDRMQDEGHCFDSVYYVEKSVL